MQVSNTKWGNAIVKAYLCGWSRDRGDTVCENRLRRPMDELNGALIDWIRTNVLRDELVTAVLDEARRLVDREDPSHTPAIEAIEAELRKLQGEVQRITLAIATTDAAPEALAKALLEREGRIKELRQRLAVLHQADTPIQVRWPDLEAEARARLVELRGAFDANPAEARTALAALLQGPIQCTPVRIEGRPRYRLTGDLILPIALVAADTRTANQSECERPQRDLNPSVCHEIAPSTLKHVADSDFDDEFDSLEDDSVTGYVTPVTLRVNLIDPRTTYCPHCEGTGRREAPSRKLTLVSSEGA